MPKEKSIRNLKQYIDEIFQISGNGEYWYRGQSQEWTLKPKIARLSRKNVGKNLSEIEIYLFYHFWKYAYPHISQRDFNKWDQLCIAQHHYLPTRLLDWTHCPLSAIFFAVWEESRKDACVYILNPNFNRVNITQTANPFEIKKLHTFTPSHKTARIVTQRGNFTAHPYPFSQLIPSKLTEYGIKRVIIAKSAKKKIRQELETIFGINEFTLFPGLDSIGKHLTWKAETNQIRTKKENTSKYRESIKKSNLTLDDAIAEATKLTGMKNTINDKLLKSFPDYLSKIEKFSAK